MVGNLGNQGMLQANVTTKFSMEFVAVAKCAWIARRGKQSYPERALFEQMRTVKGRRRTRVFRRLETS